MKSNPVLKAIVVIIIVTLCVGLILYLFGGTAGFGMNGYGRIGFNNNYGMMGESGNGFGMMGGSGNNYGMMGGFASGQGSINLGNILSTLFPILLALSVLGLVVGLVVYLYQLITTRDQNAVCSHCSAKMPDGAKFCPTCGTKA